MPLFKYFTVNPIDVQEEKKLNQTPDNKLQSSRKAPSEY